MIFWSFLGFGVIYGHFRGFEFIWVILKVFGVFLSFSRFKCILVIFRFQGYIGYFLGLWGIFVIL